MRREWVRWSWKGTALLWTALGMWTSGLGQRLYWLSTLGGNVSDAYGVSADGRFVVGTTLNATGKQRAFLWDRETLTMRDLGIFGWYAESAAYDVSANGRFIVGYVGSSGWFRGVVWDAQTGVIRELESLPNGDGRCMAEAISLDGQTVVGSAISNFQYSAVRWDMLNGSIFNLGTFGGTYNSAAGVSANGTIIVGTATTPSGYNRAFRWTLVDGMMDLGTLGGTYSEAYAVSPDGSTVVGSAAAEDTLAAFRWTQSDGMQRLIAWNAQSHAFGVSADGSIVVGTVLGTDSQFRAFRWRKARGVEDLNTTYAALLRHASVLSVARDISPDGRYIVGWGYNAATGRTEAFLLDTCANSPDIYRDGCVDDMDLLLLLFRFGRNSGGADPADINCDGVVDDADLLMVLFNFGQGC